MKTTATTTRLFFAACLGLSLASLAGCDAKAQTQDAEPQEIPISAAQASRLQAVMVPLIAKMDHPIPASEISITLLDDSHINAANAGGGKFLVTKGLLQKANDNQLRAILAHETAHADLGHVAQIQLVSTGLSIGISLLDQIFPGSSALSPIAGQFLENAYSRNEETQADAHGVTILNRAGYNGKDLMANTLGWLAQEEGTSDGGGGFFSTHPATGDRIQAVQNL